MKAVFYINGQIVKNPDGFKEFAESLVRDEEKRHVYFDYPLELTFIGDGYDLLDEQYQQDYNSQVELKAERITQIGSELLLKTNIKLSNCTFNLTTRTVVCELDDLTYQSYIFNNYKVKVGATTETTKNGETIASPITPTYITLFEPTNGANFAATRRCIDVKDAFTAIITYISDGNVSFQSSWYDNLDDDKKLAISLGSELRLNSDERDPVTNLKDLFDNLWKKYNLYLIVENPITNPVIRLEQESYLTDASNTITLRNVSFVERSLDYERLYGRIVVGSRDYIRDYGSTYTLPYLQLLGFSEEEYNVGGVIGVDNELDLISDYIIDHNVFEDLIDNNNDDYDEDIFLIQYDSSTNIATKGTYYTNGSARYYNEELLNSSVLNRFQYLGEVILQSSQNNQGFQAENTTPSTESGLIGTSFVSVINQSPWPFQDDSTGDNYDAGGNYNITTWKYTCPTDGIYRFRYFQPFILSTGSTKIRLRGTTNFLKNASTVSPPDDVKWVNTNGQEQVVPYSTFQLQGYALNVENEPYAFILEQTIDCLANDEIQVGAEFEIRKSTIAGGAEAFSFIVGQGLFLSVQTALDGGIFESKDPDDYYVNMYAFDRFQLTDEQWNIIREKPSVQIKFDTEQGDFRLAYPKEISRNFETGETDFKLLFNRKQSVI